MIKILQAVFLFPFTAIFWIVVSARNLLFDWRILPSREFSIPVISVGNLAAGGTGKTPHVEYLVSILKDQYKVAILSRGYKRKTRGFHLAGEGVKVSEIGDEPFQVKKKFPGIMVAVDEKRSHGIQELLKQTEVPDVIILDDAFQHRYVRPGLSILLDEFTRPAAKDFMLPGGRLREPYASRKRADIIILTKTPASATVTGRRFPVSERPLKDYHRLYFTTMTPGSLQGIFMEEKENIPLAKKPNVLLVSGIANPRTLIPMVRGISTNFREIVFSDHHQYTEKDALSILKTFRELDRGNSIVVTTEKDAVKLAEFEDIFSPVKEKMFYFPIFVEFLNNDAMNFNTQVLNYVKSNTRNSNLHKA